MVKKNESPANPFVPVEEQPYSIPENWCWIRFQDAVEILNGFAFKSEKYVDKGIRIIRIANVQDGYLEDHKPVFYPFEAEQEIQKYILKSDDLLMSLTGNVGRVAFLSSDMLPAALNQRVACLRLNSFPLKKKLLFFYMSRQEFQDSCIKNSKGTAQLNMSTEWLKQQLIPLSPFSEQQRIVARIESLFARLDEAKEKAQAVMDGFELRKSAILHKAFTGELTERWRKERGIGLDSWAKVKLIDVLTEKPRNGYSPKPVNYITPYKSMTLSATTSGVFKEEHFKYIDEAIPDDSYLWLKPGDILIQRANSLDKVGTSAIYTGREREFIYPDLMMKLQVVKTTSPHFVAYSLKRDDTLAYFRANATGTAGNMPKINQKIVSQTPLNLPTFDEQVEIVCTLDNIFKQEQQAKEATEAVLDQIDTMKKAILARAFRGELGTNDPAEEWAGEMVRKCWNQTR